MVIEKETQAAMAVMAPRFIVPGSTVSADESDAYDLMHAKYNMRRVNHSREYQALDGTTNNQAESYFSRFRRMHIGQIHRLAPKYLDRYAHEVAFREDTRIWANGRIFLDIVGKCAHALTSRDWCGYLWVFHSASVAHYVLDPSRSAKVPATELAGVPSGVLSCDRYAAYIKMARQHRASYCRFAGRTNDATSSNLATIIPSCCPGHCAGWIRSASSTTSIGGVAKSNRAARTTRLERNTCALPRSGWKPIVMRHWPM